MRPVIAIAMQYADQPGWFGIDAHYVTLFEGAGAGCSLVAPTLDDESLLAALGHTDALVVPGGNDIDPALFGQSPNGHNDPPVPLRDHAEFALVRRARELDMPFLGICRGMQVMNVAFGGDLRQNIAPDRGAHWQDKPYERPHHEVLVASSTPLAAAIGAGNHMVNSMHHQCVDRLADHTHVAARAADGVIEALWRDDCNYFLAVQWHPEYLADGPSTALARSLVDAAARYAARKRR